MRTVKFHWKVNLRLLLSPTWTYEIPSFLLKKSILIFTERVKMRIHFYCMPRCCWCKSCKPVASEQWREQPLLAHVVHPLIHWKWWILLQPNPTCSQKQQGDEYITAWRFISWMSTTMCAQTGPCLLTIVHHMKEDPELYLSHPEDNLITCYNSTVYLDKEYSLKLNLRHFDLYKVMGFLVCIFFFYCDRIFLSEYEWVWVYEQPPFSY